MKLRPASSDDLKKMMSWFPDARACAYWGGPEFRFPFNEASFVEDSRLNSVPSFVCIESSGEFVGFGQYYLRVGRCHLSRLAIAPDRRGRGCGSWLVSALVATGSEILQVPECSLFVAFGNTRAERLYERLGFTSVPYPESAPPVPDSVYMIGDARRIERARLTPYD